MTVTFESGLHLDLASLLGQSWRAFFQSSFYILSSIAFISLVGWFMLGWGFLQSLIFASMVGGEITAAVVIPLAFTLKLTGEVRSILTIETAVSTVYSVVLFYAFLENWVRGSLSYLDTVSSIFGRFAIGIVLGVVLALPLLKVLSWLEDEKYTPILTLGLTLAVYSTAECLEVTVRLQS